MAATSNTRQRIRLVVAGHITGLALFFDTRASVVCSERSQVEIVNHCSSWNRTLHYACRHLFVIVPNDLDCFLVCSIVPSEPKPQKQLYYAIVNGIHGPPWVRRFSIVRDTDCERALNYDSFLAKHIINISVDHTRVKSLLPSPYRP
jgi:hypothetical protein